VSSACSRAFLNTATGLPSGKDIAEAFASTWDANAFFRQRSTE
jgi:hypothetical protein